MQYSTRVTAESLSSRSCSKLALPLVLVVLLGGATLRLVRLTDPPLDHHPNRQYHSALLARGLYADHAAGWSDGRRAFARESMPHLIEPPLMETATVWLYRAVGFEALWLARLLSVLAWTLGGLGLYYLAARWFSAPAVIVSLAVYTYLPFGILASRSFQPDPLMIALVIAAVERAAAWFASRRPTTGAVALAVGALAVFVKPMALLLLLPVYCAFVVAMRHRGWRAIAVLPGILACVAAPATLYFATTMVRRGELDDYTQLAAEFSVFALREFWAGWRTTFVGAVTVPLLPCLCCLAVAIQARGARLVIGGLWAGYLLLALAFPYHIYTHDYYSLVTIPLIALTAGYALEVLSERLRWLNQERLQRVAIATLAAVVAAGAISVLRVDNRTIVEIRDRLEELDRTLPENAGLIVLDDSYGKSILFHSARRVAVWPLSLELHARAIRGLPVPSFEELATVTGGADYFVVTATNDLTAQPELRARLALLPQLPSRLATSAGSIQVYDLKTAVPPRISPLAANFAFVRSGRFRTPPQTLQVQMAGFAARAWSFAVPPESSITVTPSSGVGDATVTIDVHPNVANGTAAVAFTAPGTPPSQIAVRWATIEGASKAPIGNLEAPAPDVGAGALTFGGWAMDDLGIKRVILVGVDVNGRERELAVTASFGVRPDLQQTFASWPGAGRGAWAVTLDPAATRDLALVRAEAEDVEGQRTTIGQRVLRASARETKSVALRIGAKGRPSA